MRHHQWILCVMQDIIDYADQNDLWSTYNALDNALLQARKELGCDSTPIQSANTNVGQLIFFPKRS